MVRESTGKRNNICVSLLSNSIWVYSDNRERINITNIMLWYSRIAVVSPLLDQVIRRAKVPITSMLKPCCNKAELICFVLLELMFLDVRLSMVSLVRMIVIILSKSTPDL